MIGGHQGWRKRGGWWGGRERDCEICKLDVADFEDRGSGLEPRKAGGFKRWKRQKWVSLEPAERIQSC